MVKGEINPIETKDTLEGYKLNEWTKLDRSVRATIQMHLSGSLYFIVQSCLIAFQQWKTLSDAYEKKVVATNIYLIQRL